MKILVTGATGFLGPYLVEELLRLGHQITIITRQSAGEFGPTPYRLVHWPLDSADRESLLENEVVINLAGESVAGQRWSAERKEELRYSRMHFTRTLVDIFAASPKLKTFISSSAIGYYGDRKSEILTEESPHGEGFLAELCRDWEAEASRLKQFGPRIAFLRTGIVLDRKNGVLGELEPLARIGAAGVVGSGEQFMSWIHVDDWVRAVIHVLNNPVLKGAINLVAPEPVTNRSFSAVYGELFGLPVQMPAPAFALKLAFGEQAQLMLSSQNVRPEKLMASHFGFKFSILRDALLNLYGFTAESREKKIYDLYRQTQWVNAPVEQVFKFFSNEKNLERLTPENLHFHVLKKSTEQMMAGTLIDYDLKIHGVPVSWRTKIDEWQPPHRFVDTQLWGPYSLWRHTHTFESLAGGTLMKDSVQYSLPGGGLGRAAGLWYVKRDVEKIFSFRRQKINESSSDFFAG
jgi:uncharacterized protein